MLILDSSAAIAIAFERPEGEILRSLTCKGERVVAPELYLAEMAHAVEKYVRGGYVSAATGATVFDKAVGMVDELVPMAPLAREALSESLRLWHSSYDMFYFVLARRNAATLCTLDRRLQKLCLANGVNCISVTDVEGERWTIRTEVEEGPAGLQGYTREELERAIARDAGGA